MKITRKLVFECDSPIITAIWLTGALADSPNSSMAILCLNATTMNGRHFVVDSGEDSIINLEKTYDLLIQKLEEKLTQELILT